MEIGHLLLRDTGGHALGLMLNLALSVEGRAPNQGSSMFVSLRQQCQALLKNPFII